MITSKHIYELTGYLGQSLAWDAADDQQAGRIRCDHQALRLVRLFGQQHGIESALADWCLERGMSCDCKVWLSPYSFMGHSIEVLQHVIEFLQQLETLKGQERNEFIADFCPGLLASSIGNFIEPWSDPSQWR